MLNKIKKVLSFLKPKNIWKFTKKAFTGLLDLTPRKVFAFCGLIIKKSWKALKYIVKAIYISFNPNKVSKVRFVIASLLLALFIALNGIMIWILTDNSYEISQTAGKEKVTYSNTYAPSDSYISSSGVTPRAFSISFPSSVANHELLDGKNIEKGISIKPEIRGKWNYSVSYALYFYPEKDWLPNTKYTVELSDEIFSENVEVSSNAKNLTFSSPTFKGWVSSSSFYEDPRDIKNKHVIATFKFNYPINKEDLKSKVSIKSYKGEKYSFTIKEDDSPNTFHVSTEPVRIKAWEDFVEIKVAGLENAYNKTTITSPVVAKVTIPSSSTFFKLYSINTRIVENQDKNNEPEQIIFVNFSTSVKSSELDEYVEFYGSDKRCYDINVNNDTELGKYSTLRKLDLEKVSVGDGKNHMFKYDITKRNSCILTRIKKGISSVDGFIMDGNIVKKNDIANYPMEAKIAFDGSILSLKGDKTLSLSSRGINEINVKVSRIDSKDLNHLASQTSGDFSYPSFRSYTFDEDNIAENFEKKLKINSVHPAKVDYSSVNLGEYFRDKKGMFIVKVRGKNEHSSTSEDRRFVLITDLGIVVKKNIDNSQNVFVSSFSDGMPISGVKVQVLGKNGVPILESYTNSVGMATIPDFSNFNNEKQAVVFVVTNGSDVSFMPVNKYDRLVDNSKFDIEGEYESSDNNKIKGFIFSDRGIYRPGENAKIGIMVRNQDLNAPNKIPFEVDIINSRGDKVFTKKIWSDEFGLLDISYDVPASAPVGSYTVSLYDVSDKNSYRKHVYSTSIKVEEFVPDSMKIKLLLENTTSKGWYKEKDLKAIVNLQNLYGNPAIEHDIRANIELTPVSFYFGEYSGYVFKDPLINKNQQRRSYSETLDTKSTDKKGEAEYVVDLGDFDRGTYSLTVNAFGYELEGGRSVVTSQTRLVSPLEYIVGYKTDGGSMYDIAKGSERSINFIAIDNTLKKIAKDALDLRIVKIDYVSSLVEMENGTYKYQNIPVEKTIVEKAISIPATGNKLDIDTTTPGSYYVLILDKEGQELSRVDYLISGGTNTNYMLDKDANLSVTLNKKEYNNGETISMKIVAPYEGYGLITIERDKVYNYKWFKTSSKTTTEEIKLPFTVEGNAYINVSFIRSSSSREIFMPPMTYAVVPFDINKGKRTVKIDLEVPKTVKPGEDLVVKYKASKPGKIIVYGVNQGILQVSKYKLPNPVSEFIKKKSLNTRTYQIMDLIMPDMKLLDMYKATGGDDADMEEALKAQKNPFARKQDEVVAFWSGVIDVEEGYKEYTYKVPAIFNGQIKVMAVAVSETAFGSTEQGVFARGDFALVPSAPFNVSPSDEFDVGTSIANMVEGSGNDYEVKVVLDPSSGFEVVGTGTEQIIKISENDEKSVKFKLKALEKLGSNTIKFKVTGLNDETKNFEMPYHIGIRPASPYITKMKMGYEERTLKLKDYPMPMYNEFRKQEISASISPIVLAEGILKFLDVYPHLCSEQMISRTYPAMEIFFKYPDLVKGTDIYKLFDQTIALLAERQKLDGGISLWTYEGAKADEYASLYAYDFLSKAETLGFNVPKGMLNRLLPYVKSVAGRDASSLTDENPAYAIYLLTRNGENTSTYLVNAENVYKAKDPKKWTSSLSSSYLASSYKMLKNGDKSRELLGKHKYGESSIRDSKYIFLMSTYFEDDIKLLSKDVTQALLEPLKNPYFTTNMSAHSLFALSSYARSKDKEIVIEGKDVDYSSFAKADISSSDKVLNVSAKDPFYYVVREQGYSRETGQKAQSNFVEISKEILNDKDSVVTSAKVGDELTVRIRVNAHKKNYIDNVAITDLLSGGFEMVIDSINSTTYLDNSEAREDRALIYLGINNNVTTITYRVKAIARGTFVVPASYAEALYDGDVRGNSKGFAFTIE